MSSLITWLAFIGLLVTACGGAESTPPSQPTPTVTAEPTRQPEPAEVGPGRIRAILDATYTLAIFGADVTLTYTARTEGAGRLSRVRLIIDDKTDFDTGDLSEREVSGTRTLNVGAGSQHAFLLLADSPGSRPTTARSIVRCPSAPPGQRVQRPIVDSPSATLSS